MAFPELFLNFVTIGKLTGVFQRTTRDKYGKIRMSTVKLKNGLILTLENVSNIVDIIFK